MPGWYQTSRGVEPSARTAVPALLSWAMFAFVQAGPEAADDGRGRCRRWRQLHHGRAEGAVRGGLAGAGRRGEGSDEAARGARGGGPRRAGSGVSARSTTSARAGDVRASTAPTRSLAAAREGLAPAARAAAAAPTSTPTSTSRPAGRAASASRARRPGAEVGGVTDEHGRGAASGCAASRASIERTTSTSTPWSRSTSASARAPSGPVPSGSRAAVGRCGRERQQHHEQHAPAATTTDVGRGAPHPVAVPAARCRGTRGAGAVLGRVALIAGLRRRWPGPAAAGGWRRGRRPARSRLARPTRRGGAPAVAHGVEGVGGDGERRGGCREHRPPARPPPRARCGRAGRRAGCARRRTGRARGRPRAPRCRRRRPRGRRPAAARCSAAVRVGPSSTPLAARARHPALGAQRAHQRPARPRPRRRRSAIQIVQPGRPRCRSGAGEEPVQPVPEPFEQPLLLVVDRPCAARPRAIRRASGDVGSRGGSSRTGSAGPGGTRPRGGSALLGRVDELHVEALAADPLVDGHQGVDPGRERRGDARR